jgi:uncharacterized damage-inducible protein DinB
MSELQLDDHQRPEPPLEAGEVPTLLGFLEYQRGTLSWKTAGLSDEQLRSHLAPTTMTLGGILKHMALVEDYWFTNVIGERDLPEPWASHDEKEMPDWEWQSAAEDSAEYLRRLWEERCESSREVVRQELGDEPELALGRTHPAWGGQGQVSLRWVLVHMVEEYARHNGHADLLRESIDGETGE